MSLPYRIAGGAALAAGIIGLTGNIYAYQNEIVPSKPLVPEQAVSQPLESRASDKTIAKPSLDDIQYLNGVVRTTNLEFIDAKTGKNVVAKSVGGLVLSVGTNEDRIVYFSEIGGYGLGWVRLEKSGNTLLEITKENIAGGHSGNLGPTNPEAWKSFEDEYSRLSQTAAEEARKKFPDAAAQERSLIDILNKK